MPQTPRMVAAWLADPQRRPGDEEQEANSVESSKSWRLVECRLAQHELVAVVEAEHLGDRDGERQAHEQDLPELALVAQERGTDGERQRRRHQVGEDQEPPVAAVPAVGAQRAVGVASSRSSPAPRGKPRRGVGCGAGKACP